MKIEGKGMDINLFHSLEGKNIYFKSLSLSEAEQVHSYASDEDVSRFIGWPLMKTLDETSKYIETMLNRESAGTHLYASIVLKSTEENIGTAMIFNFDKEANKAEVGYVFHKNHWGKGYGTECVTLLSNFGFEVLNLHKLHGTVVDANIGSARILERNGFKLEGRLRDHFFIEDKYYDALLFGKIKNSIFKQFPDIKTNNLLLRRMEHKDIQDVFQMRRDARMHEFTDTKADKTEEETRVYIDKMNKGVDENKWILWAIEEKLSKKVIGIISIWNINKEQKSAELGYGIIPDYQGKGLMKEALLSVVEYGFKVMNLKALEAYTEENNIKSLKLLESSKFVKVKKVDDQGFNSNRVFHMSVYRLENTI